MSDLRTRLHALGLAAASAALGDLVALATKKRWGPTEILEHVEEEPRPATRVRARREHATRGASAEEVAQGVSSKDIEILPGEHAFRFELDGAPPVSQSVLVRKGEKARPIEVRFESAHPQSMTGARPASQVAMRPTPLGVYVLGGVALAARGLLRPSGGRATECSHRRRGIAEGRVRRVARASEARSPVDQLERLRRRAAARVTARRTRRAHRSVVRAAAHNATGTRPLGRGAQIVAYGAPRQSAAHTCPQSWRRMP